MALDWDPNQRAGALLAVEDLISQPLFTPTAYERRYLDPRIDDSKHSGESILALEKVLKALEGDPFARSERPRSNGV